MSYQFIQTISGILELVKSSLAGQRASMHEVLVQSSTPNRMHGIPIAFARLCVFRGLKVNYVPSAYHSLPELLKHTLYGTL